MQNSNQNPPSPSEAFTPGLTPRVLSQGFDSSGVRHKRGVSLVCGALLVLVIASPRPVQSSPGFSFAEAIFTLSQFHLLGGLTPNLYGLAAEIVVLFVATSGPGLHIIDLTTGEIVRSKDLSGLPMFGVVPHLKDDLGCLFGYGAGSARTCYFPEIDDFGATEIGFGLFTDAGLLSPTPVEEPSGQRHLIWSVGNAVFQEHQPGGPGTAVQRRQLFNEWYAGGMATGRAMSAAFNNDASKVVVVRGDPAGSGQVWSGDPAEVFDGGALIGELGNDTRKIRCALPICAVSNFLGLVTILVWDGLNPPEIIGAIPDTMGAVGIDVAQEGDNWSIRSADFNNNTVTKTIVTPAGEIVSSITRPVPEGCTNPGHVISLVDEQDGLLKTVVSCNGVNEEGQSAIAVLTDEIFFAS